MTHNALKQQMLEAAEKAPAGSWFYDSYSTILSTVEIIRDEKHNEGTSSLVCGVPAFSGDQAYPPDTYTAVYIEATQPTNVRSLIEGYETKLALARKEALAEMLAVSRACMPASNFRYVKKELEKLIAKEPK